MPSYRGARRATDRARRATPGGSAATEEQAEGRGTASPRNCLTEELPPRGTASCLTLATLLLRSEEMAEKPYWLSGFEAVCAGCEHLVSHAVEIRCFDCDEPFCPVCVVFVESRAYCADCDPGREKES